MIQGQMLLLTRDIRKASGEKGRWSKKSGKYLEYLKINQIQTYEPFKNHRPDRFSAPGFFRILPFGRQSGSK